MNSFLLEKVGKTYNEGCCMLYLNVSLDELHDKINKKDLTEDGIEDEPHVTLLYGFKENVDIDDIKKAIDGIEFGEIKLLKVSLFENDEHDVLKYDVSGDGLKEAFAKLNKIPNDNKYDDYKPHITLGYIKSGKGQKYVDIFNGIKFTAKPMFVVYSPGGDNDKIIIGIKKK